MCNEQKKDNGSIKLISLLLGIATIASATAYLIYRCFNNHIHEEKWKDYDECGRA